MELVSSIVVYAEHKISFTKEFCFLPAQKTDTSLGIFPNDVSNFFIEVFADAFP